MQGILVRSRRPRAQQALGSFLFTAVACGAAVYLLHPSGPIAAYADLDLSFLIVPLLGYYLLRLLSRLGSALMTASTGEAAVRVLNGIAFAFLGYYLLSRAVLFAGIPDLQSYKWLLSGLSSIASYAIPLALAYILIGLSGFAGETPKIQRIYPASRATGQLLVGYSLWRILAAFTGSWPPADRLGLVIFAGMIALAGCSLAAYGEGSSNPPLARASRWLREGALGKFLIGSAAAAYIVFARPTFIDIFRYSPLVEWAIVCFVAWRLFSGVRAALQRRYPALMEGMEWRRHSPRISRLTDRNFNHLGAVQRRFVQEGERDGLLVNLALLLSNNGLREDAIRQVLHPLINHHDRETPWFAFGWEQRRILRQKQRDRQRILDDIMGSLRAIAQPHTRE